MREVTVVGRIYCIGEGVEGDTVYIVCKRCREGVREREWQIRKWELNLLHYHYALFFYHIIIFIHYAILLPA